MAMLVTLGEVKKYLQIDTATTTWDDLIAGEGGAGSASGQNLIEAASAWIERMSGHTFAVASNVTKVYSSEGQSLITIDCLISPTSVTRQGNGMTQDTDFWLLPDRRDRRVSHQVQFRQFSQWNSGPGYLSNPQWFELNLDRAWARYGDSAPPNDISITGIWGHPDLPSDVHHAVLVMCAYFFKRKDALPAGAVFTPEGVVSDFRDWPIELADFGRRWSIKTHVQAV